MRNFENGSETSSFNVQWYFYEPDDGSVIMSLMAKVWHTIIMTKMERL